MSGFALIEGDVTLYDSAGVELAVEDATALPANTRGFVGVGYDGTNTRFIRVDASGYQVFVGAGVAGTPAGGVVSVQGVSGGQALPISGTVTVQDGGGSITVDGTVTALQGTAAALAGAWPVQLTEGTVVLGTGTNPVRVDPTGTTAQPVTDNGGSLTVDDGGGSITIDTTQLPSTLLGGRLDTNIGAWLGSTVPTVGQKAMVSSIPVAIASNQSAIPVSQSGTWTIQQGTPPWVVVGTDADGSPSTENPVLTAGEDSSGDVQTLLTDDDGRQVVTRKASTAAVTSVAKSATSVQILAANADRLGASIHNDSNRSMYLKLGTAATSTSFTVKLDRDFHYEVPFGYTGVLHAVWDSGGSGSARVTEVTS